ncbi:N-acyl-D-amino-acid deacylase family protein [Kordiimonas pumila]|uniref:Amidohydrolase family protein n=1 Tax=Kordiimonas pumila TaxID=2161677 RepID=A0ABV7D5Z2_9PROT|nr:amidohydrolase family protein [Kordiimonas pumila]
MNRNRLARKFTGLVLLGVGCFSSSGWAEETQKLDLLISGGAVFTGDLEPSKITDIGIVDDKIVFIGNASAAHLKAVKTLDATGMMVAPGFVDPHTHIDPEIASDSPQDRLVLRQLKQGVTTSIIGVDGSGSLAIKEQRATAERQGVGQNFASYVGFGPVRMSVLGEYDKSPTPDELQKMKELVANGMCDGALGFSTGLFYAPQSYASINEVIALAKEAGKRGGIYDTHQRDEGNSSVGVYKSLKEAIRIGEESGAPLHIAHIKVTGLSDPSGETIGQLISLIEEARANGQAVTADQYPWSAANTGLVSVAMPRWVQDGGRNAMLKRFENAADVAKIKADSALVYRLADKIMISDVPAQPEIVGMFLSDIAAMWAVDAVDASIRILKHSAEVSIAVFVMEETDIKKVMPEPWVMTSSDGGADGGHPRGYASYPRLWTNYVVGEKTLTPEQFVHRSSGFVADTLGLKGRGYLKPGYFADIVVIDTKSYQPIATYKESTLLSTGVQHVIVNGKIELENGEPTGILSGRGLVKNPPANDCP